MSRILKLLAAVVASVGFVALPFHADADPSEAVCKTPGPCRTISIVREQGSTTFVLFGGFTFAPLPHWIQREIVEISEGNYVRFKYERADKTTACELAFMTFGRADPGFDGAWDMFFGRDVKRGDAKIIVEEQDAAHARGVAILKYNGGETMQVALRRIEDAPKAAMYEFAIVGVAAATAAIDKTHPDVSACHVRRAPV